MIITFTPNPSLDRTVTLNAPLAPGGVHRIEIDQLQPGGKGINVAFGLQRAGLDTLAIFQAAQGDPLWDLVRGGRASGSHQSYQWASTNKYHAAG